MASFFVAFLGFTVYQNIPKVYQAITIAWIVSIGLGVVFYLLYFFFKTKSARNVDRAFRQVAIQGVIALVLCIIAIPVGAKGLEFVGIVKKTPVPSVNNKVFPIANLELKNVQWKANVFQADILNKSDKPAYDIKITFKMSKARQMWEVDEDFNFTVPYKIDPGQTITVKETATSAKTNPWTTAWIISAKYYSGEIVPTTPSSPTQKVYVNPDPIIDCKFTYIGTMKLRKSVCSKSTDCQIGDRWIYYDSVDRCKADQKTASNLNLVDCVIAGKTYRTTREICDRNIGGTGTTYTSPYYSCRLCSRYSSGDSCSTYNYLVKSKSECDTEQSKIDSLGSAYVLPTNIPTQTTSTLSQACNDQYQRDIQGAKTWGGSVAEVMLETAYDNYRSCLSTGTVRTVDIQHDTRPRDRTGTLCSDYEPSFHSLGVSMGCQ